MIPFEPRSVYVPPDMQRTYIVLRLNAASRKHDVLGSYLCQRAALQGNAGYGDAGITVDYEERVNFPQDSLVAIGDVVQCREDGQVWDVKAVRRQPTFRVAYLQRSGLARSPIATTYS